MFINNRKIFDSFSIILSIAAIISIAVFGLNFGIDFTGGSVLSIQYKNEVPDFDVVRAVLEQCDLGEITLQKSEQTTLILKTKTLDERTHQEVAGRLRELAETEPGTETFESIGPVIGQELKAKTKIVIILALIAILIYIAYTFRKISKPVRSYIYGFTSLIALFHDVLIPLGIFALLGRFYNIEINIPLITAFLTVFGYSINDSVVVFDRVRENLLKFRTNDFDQTVEKSLRQSLTRSFNTSITTLVSLFAIFFFGGASLKFFSLALILGIGLGTYSSLCLATPLLTTYLRFKERKFRKPAIGFKVDN